MQYIYVSSPDIVTRHIVTTLLSHLEKDERVAWFLSGGSAIALEVAAAEALKAHDTSRLAITLIDERYGPLGHADENYMQVMNAGFPLPMTRVLTGASAEETTAAFAANFEHILSTADFSLGVFGIGADGHTAGIKPHSPATASTEAAIFYEWDDYQRITMTVPAIRRLDEAIIYAVGSEKAATLHTLLHDAVAIEDQPAQVLKDIKTATLYTDNTR